MGGSKAAKSPTPTRRGPGAAPCSPRAAAIAIRRCLRMRIGDAQRRRQRFARGGRTRRRLCAVRGAPSGNHGAKQCLRGGNARGLALRRADRLKAAWEGPFAYPVAVAVEPVGHGIAAEPALAGRPASRPPIGSSPGCGSFARPERRPARRPHGAAVAATAQRALTAKLDDLGSAASAPISPARATRPVHEIIRS